jgi:CheY-like chemotaxis protein
MKMEELNYYYNKFKFGEDIFHQLMQRRVRDILLVSTFYDAFIFEQDGRLSEQIFGEYRQLNLTTAPRITSVPTGADALEKLKERSYDLVITMMRIGEIGPFQLAKKIKETQPDLPVLLLLNVASDYIIWENHAEEKQYIDDVFLWNGDTKLFLAMVKNIEDNFNVEFDTAHGLVRVILLVEDSIHYYSLFLPSLYSVIMKQTQKLIEEEVSDINKRLRMRIRPKVLLAHDYDEAMRLYKKYREYLLCVISDVRYKIGDEVDPIAASS